MLLTTGMPPRRWIWTMAARTVAPAAIEMLSICPLGSFTNHGRESAP